MLSVEAIFMAVGKSPTVLMLADQLTGELQQRRAIGDSVKPSNIAATTNSIIMKLPIPATDDDLVFAETERWLQRHDEILKTVDGRKIIEFQTFLGSNTGSRILTVPNSIVKLCGSLGLDIANQAIRVYTKAERDQMQRGKS
jgi:hypothetical protein